MLRLLCVLALHPRLPVHGNDSSALVHVAARRRHVCLGPSRRGCLPCRGCLVLGVLPAVAGRSEPGSRPDDRGTGFRAAYGLRSRTNSTMGSRPGSPRHTCGVWQPHAHSPPSDPQRSTAAAMAANRTAASGATRCTGGAPDAHAAREAWSMTERQRTVGPLPSQLRSLNGASHIALAEPTGCRG